MAEAENNKEEEAKKVIAEIGKQLAGFKTCPNKTILVKLLKQATNAFPELKQSESLRFSIEPLSESFIKHGLLDHKDKDVRLLVGICLCEVIRVLAPNPGFNDAVSRDIFRFLLSVFGELDDIASPYFSRRARLLETVAKLQFCLVMLDTGCEDLVLKMFKIFFSVVREDHPQSLISSMSSIITSILEEKLEADPDSLEKSTSQSLLDVILQNIIKERKGVVSSSFRLSVSVIQNCGEKLERCICQFLISCILNRDAVGSVIKESYHEIILEMYQISPQMLLSVIPYLTNELLTDQVDVRIKALNLVRKLLALHGQHVAREYPHVFIELLNRFSDKSVEVRLTALSCAKALCMTNPSGRESLETLAAIQGRLLDHDDRVRIEAVNVVCELAKSNLNFKSSDLITQAAERLRDKKVSVRSKALKKLVELYHEYCTRRAAGITLLNEHIEEIPCKILMLCYEKDCQEFRPQSMELVLGDLFPPSLSTEERTRHWIFMFSLFKPPHLKALQIILSQKRRLRDGLKDYLDVWIRAKENVSGEVERKMDVLAVKMSSCFPDPAKAKDCFQKLKELKDDGIFSMLQEFLREGMTLDSETIKDVYLRESSDQKALCDFFHQLSRKCSFNIFGSEHVRYILDCLSSDEAEKMHVKNHQVQLLLTIISAFPSFLRGSEKQFQLLLHGKDIPLNEQLIEMLARDGCHMPIKLSDIYSSLEKVCLEGTRVQSKLAVAAIAALADTSEQFIFSELCKTLVDSLHNGQNAPTVLQSLGCMAQHSPSAFEAQGRVITHYIVEKIFQQNDAVASKHLDHFDEASNCCSSCKLKVFGLKALVRSFLPHKHAGPNHSISFLLDIIQQMLQNDGFFASNILCGCDEAFIRLAAAKAILRLSRKWDLHISPLIFRLTILRAKDHSSWVRRSFANKIHKLLTNHALPSRYACAFSFVALDPVRDLCSDGLKYLEEFIREYVKRAQIHETMTMKGTANHPVYIAVFLIHVLAHDSNFPAPDCQDEKVYARFLSPLFVTVQALVNGNLVDGNLHLLSNASSYLRSIFNAIKRAEDAVDVEMTPKLHLLAEVGISVLDSLNINYMPVPHSPGLILLPSSLFKSGSSEMREGSAYPFIECKADASFTKRLVSCLKTEVSEIDGGTDTQHTQQVYENSSRPSGTRHSRSNSRSGYANNSLINKSKQQTDELHTGQEKHCDTSNCEVDTSAQQNQALPSHLGSVLHNKFSAENINERDAHRNLGAKSSFLCDSAKTKFPLSQNKVIVSCSRGEDTVTKCDSICNEPSKLSGAGDQVNCFTSKITYETGEVDILSLDSEKWEIIPNKEFGSDDSGDFSANGQAKIDTSGCDSNQENLPKNRDICSRKASKAVKRTKMCDDAIGTSTSEVTDMSGNNRVRRTRRKKV
ncbi:Sister chromatid cohesion complex Cohesin, subunit PDS5 [Handroanthus impetiginosus]|uniref:Sister chromatid cohesion complex Cohesin, subunit PDS5 n=1 Tax=Handroanthus impetiginosus TaxID=429701 RepID=A0A2G9HF49_9LAMI|nr:Sister chromatid cohesion complex Cohesin, subunit PDS5 [Handroanthus impetiginosus]